MSDRHTPSSSSSGSSTLPPPPHPYTSPSSVRPPTSTETLHPLLAPIGQPLASGSSIAPPHIPEKCLTFCSQRADGPPLCRMLCLRRRAKVLSRAEELSRLKGRDIRKERSEGISTEGGLAVSSSNTSTTNTPSFFLSNIFPTHWSFNPFAALRRAADPYSIIYVRGTPDGVIGRYMEEMESDDGHRDFGESISRHAKQKGREERVMEYLDWGEEGALLHLPLTSVVHPITSIPATVKTIFTPSYRILSLYVRSFTDGNGTQLRGAQNFLTAAYNLDGVTFLGKIREYHNKVYKEALEKTAQRRKEMQKVLKADLDRQEAKDREVKAKMEGFKVDQNDSGRGPEEGKKYQGEIDRLKTGTGGSGLRRKIEEAMEKDEEYRRRKAADAAGAGAGSGGKGDTGGKSDEA